MAETMLCINEHVASDLFAARQGIERGTAGRGRDPVVAMKDGRWVTIAGDPAAAEAFSRFCRACGHPELIDDPAYVHFADRRAKRQELIAMIQRAVLEMDSFEEVHARFGAEQLATGLLRSLDEFVATPWAEHRSAVIEVSDRNGGTIAIPNSPWRFSDGETGVRGEPAYRGEHNKEVLIEILGLPEKEVDELIEKGVMSSRGPSARKPRR